MEDNELKSRILRILTLHARTSDAEIADQLETTPEKVAAVIAELEADKTIMGYSLVLNNSSCPDASVRAIIDVAVQPEREGGFDNVANRIADFQEVHAVYLVSGGYDLRIEIVGNSLQDVALFVASKLATQDGVKSTVTHFLLKKYKEAGIQLHEEEKYARLKIAP